MSSADEPSIPVTPLEASSRHVLKGTLVRLKRTAGGRTSADNSLAKYGLVKQLHIDQGDTDAVRDHLTSRPGPAAHNGAQVSSAMLDVMRAFEAPELPALAPRIRDVAAINAAELSIFTQALVEVRTAQLRAVQAARATQLELARRMASLQSAVVAARSYQFNMAEQPIGLLNLERIEMTPAGLQRGELIATIPLAPGEETAVTHKEWSVTSKEFTTIVTDSLEESRCHFRSRCAIRTSTPISWMPMATHPCPASSARHATCGKPTSMGSRSSRFPPYRRPSCPASVAMATATGVIWICRSMFPQA